MFTNLLIVVAAGLLAPLALGFFPRVRLPAIVLEILLGIVIGPSVLGWAKPDAPVSILALVRLAFLLFLSGLEIDANRLRGRIVTVTALGFAVSFFIAILIGAVLRGGRLGEVSAVRRDRARSDLARSGLPGTEGLSQHRLEPGSARHHGRLDRRIRLDHPALAVLLGQELDKHGGAADPARHVWAGGGTGGSCDRKCGAVDEPLASFAAPSGHHRTDSRARGIPAADRVHGACGEGRLGDNPRRVRRWRAGFAARSGRDEPSPVPA